MSNTRPWLVLSKGLCKRVQLPTAKLYTVLTRTLKFTFTSQQILDLYLYLVPWLFLFKSCRGTGDVFDHWDLERFKNLNWNQQFFCTIEFTVWLRNSVYISMLTGYCYVIMECLLRQLAMWMYRNYSNQMFCVTSQCYAHGVLISTNILNVTVRFTK